MFSLMRLLPVVALVVPLGAICGMAAPAGSATHPRQPNILLAIGDDWGWPFAGAYGDPEVRTPNFDRLAREGVLFTQAFVSSPSCTPSRAALLTGQHFWRLEESANLWSTFQPKFRTYPELLREAGYAIGSSGKAWGPGNLKAAGYTNNPAGPNFANFEAFLKARPKDRPFCFWLGSNDPHRPYEEQSGVKSGIDLQRLKLPACWPDHETVRSDLADYCFEVQRFDALVGAAIRALENVGELENTLLVVTGDNGAPFPRAKTQLYDLGVRVPLVIRWGARIKAGRSSNALVSLTDLAPTFYAAAGLQPAPQVTGQSLMEVLTQNSDRVEGRDFVVFGRERHTLGQGAGSLLACPMRAIRTSDFLYIWNLAAERWPSGVPPTYSDCDGGPTKTFFLEHRADPIVKPLLELAFAKRRTDELYDLRKDPDQLRNVADQPEYAAVREKLTKALKTHLEATADPRLTGGGEKFDSYPYYGGKPPAQRANRDR